MKVTNFHINNINTINLALVRETEVMKDKKTDLVNTSNAKPE